MEKTKLKPKEDYNLFKQEITLCLAIKEKDGEMYDAERDRLIRRGIWFILRGFYAQAVAKEMWRLYEDE